MTSESNEDRFDALGFRPQRENPYCKILPYWDVIDKESKENLSEIKANIGRSVQECDSIGLGHWMVQLKTLINFYNAQFSELLTYFFLFFFAATYVYMVLNFLKMIT